MLSAAFIMNCHLHCTSHLEEDSVILIMQIYNYAFVQFLHIFKEAISVNKMYARRVRSFFQSKNVIL